MGLFDKKYCDVCGNKIGLLGNRKLEDGNLCKDCANKLSPWFSERRSSTVEEIKQQLEYRANNEAAVEAFTPTRTLGEKYKVYIDEANGKFLVAWGSSYKGTNPDVLNISDVTGCNLEIEENRTEIQYEDNEGNRHNYSPSRYSYSYDFNICINVNHPYFNEMKFQINNRDCSDNQPTLVKAHGGAPGRPIMAPPPPMDVRTSGVYHDYENMGNEIVSVLMGARQSARDTIAAANAPKVAVTCKCCGATTMPDENGLCEYCGGVAN